MTNFATAAFYSSTERTLPISSGGSLKIKVDEFVPYRFSLEPVSDGETEEIATCVELIDADGQVFQGGSALALRDVIGQLGALSALIPPEFCSVNDFKSGDATKIFFTGARTVLADDFTRLLAIGDESFVIPFEEQEVEISIRFEVIDGGTIPFLKALVTGLQGYRISETEDALNTLPPIQFDIDVRKYLFVNWYETEEGSNFLEETELGTPVIFEKVPDRTEEPNPLITVCKD